VPLWWSWCGKQMRMGGCRACFCGGLAYCEGLSGCGRDAMGSCRRRVPAVVSRDPRRSWHALGPATATARADCWPPQQQPASLRANSARCHHCILTRTIDSPAPQSRLSLTQLPDARRRSALTLSAPPARHPTDSRCTRHGSVSARHRPP
jgi:hypothetical protein